MVMDPDGVSTLWMNAIEDKMGEISEEDKTLVKALSMNVLARWSLRAADLSEGEIAHQAMLFKTMYADNKRLAQAVIAAILELVKAVGEGQQLPEPYRGLIH